ncbi:MAG: hypothetical protein KBT20_05180 [Bacteroidales bacterium]|nr:hypothetical protein [Candidatus Liminaster caballi]
MKKIFSTLLLCLGLYASANAQAVVMFQALPSTQEDLSAQANKNLTTKLTAAMTRNSAAAGGNACVFGIEPIVTVTNMEASQGTMQTVTLCQGELTLVAKNIVDGAQYHSVTIPLKGTVTGGEDKAMLEMIANIKPTDSQFTKFVRVAREKIQDYYANNCAAIMSKAQMLYDGAEYELCAAYLAAISEALPCFDQASQLLTLCLQNMGKDPQIVEVERVVEKPVIVEKVIEKPVVVEVPVEVPAPAPTPAPAPAAKPAKAQIVVSNGEIEFDIISVKGSWKNGRVEINTVFTNELDNRDGLYIAAKTCIDNNGADISSKFYTREDSKYSYYTSAPFGVERKHTFYILRQKEKTPRFDYLDLEIGDTKVVIRDMFVDWSE